MRQGQQNRRGRGRSNNNNNNRKNQNPLTRSFESAGPDIKIRGTPSHIAEKYISLARDALSSGDPVLAENYLQHAEHYNRIILTFREQQMAQGGSDVFTGGAVRTHSLNPHDGGEGEDFSEDEGDELSVQPMVQGEGPQSGAAQRNFEGQGRQHDQPRQSRHHQQRQDRGEGRFDRGDRGGDSRSERGGEQRAYRDDRGSVPSGDGGGFRRRDRFQGPGQLGPDANGNGGYPTRHGGDRRPVPDRQPAVAPGFTAPAPAQPSASVDADSIEQPAFLRRPVRRPRRDDAEAAASPAVTAAEPSSDDQS
jgi:hypothetical protein